MTNKHKRLCKTYPNRATKYKWVHEAHKATFTFMTTQRYHQEVLKLRKLQGQDLKLVQCRLIRYLRNEVCLRWTSPPPEPNIEFIMSDIWETSFGFSALQKLYREVYNVRFRRADMGQKFKWILKKHEYPLPRQHNILSAQEFDFVQYHRNDLELPWDKIYARYQEQLTFSPRLSYHILRELLTTNESLVVANPWALLKYEWVQPSHKALLSTFQVDSRKLEGEH
ncbi:hypothetical protein B7494_g8487 [Chlorociboria aeruginascens]|nr:hypothetical protein B7494_g8487 [Chlorociboria aeruginascens]